MFVVVVVVVVVVVGGGGGGDAVAALVLCQFCFVLFCQFSSVWPRRALAALTKHTVTNSEAAYT